MYIEAHDAYIFAGNIIEKIRTVSRVLRFWNGVKSMKKTTLIIAGVVCICVLLKNIKIEVSCKNIYLISVEEFIELYGFTEEEIAEYDIQEFIEAKGFSVQRYIDRDYDNFNIEESEKKGYVIYY